MFVDEITVQARAGNGGNGVVRWFRERSRPLGGPAGGNGGRGGSVYVRAVRDNNVLSKYTGNKEFNAEHGVSGDGRSRFGKDGEDLYIDVPVGSVVTNTLTGKRLELFNAGETFLLLKGGNGGLGNEYFKSSINRSPEEHTPGKKGEVGEFRIEVELVVSVGFIGLPNAGKSTLLNALTHAQSRVGSYPFTTLSPHLGDLYGYTLADIPGLIEGAAGGKGLGHTFLRHVKRTEMLLHLVSFENEHPLKIYDTIRAELALYDDTLLKKVEWVILTKKDLATDKDILSILKIFQDQGKKVFAISELDSDSIKVLGDELIKALRENDKSVTIEVHE